MIDDVGKLGNRSTMPDDLGVVVARVLAFVSLTLIGCDASRSAPTPSSAPAPMMERSAVEPGSPQTAEPRPEPVSTEKGDAPTQPVEPTVEYDRKAWPHWIDADSDCQDARTEVLLAESFEDVGFETSRRCEIATGRWQCPYTGQIIREVHLLDVDHLVPLANAHRSGAASWDQEKRRRYANDLAHPEHLVAVDYAANRSKRDKGPEAWLPPLDDARCQYVRDWVIVKRRWALSMSEAEAAAVERALALCEAGETPPLPQARSVVTKPAPAGQDRPDAEQPGNACCRTCNKGKACGDGCIAKTSTCTKPPGCACDGG